MVIPVSLNWEPVPVIMLKLALIELVDFNDIYGKGKGEAKEAAKKTRRSRAKLRKDRERHKKLKKRRITRHL